MGFTSRSTTGTVTDDRPVWPRGTQPQSRSLEVQPLKARSRSRVVALAERVLLRMSFEYQNEKVIWKLTVPMLSWERKEHYAPGRAHKTVARDEYMDSR